VLLGCALGGCGDAIIAVGDQPGFMRIVVGAGGSGEFFFDTLATRARISRPAGIAAASDGTIFFADQAGLILRVTPRGRLTVLHASPGCLDRSCLGRPQGLALTADESALLIADDGNGKVWQLTLASRDLRILVDSLAEPADVAVARDGRVFIAERGAGRIVVIGSDNTARTLVSGLRAPSALAIGDGVAYVAEAGSNTVRAVNLSDGAISPVAGNGTAGFSGDRGPAMIAALNKPWALALSGSNLYIADQGNDRIRIVNIPSGTIDTFAGTGSRVFNGNGNAAAETSLSMPNGLAVSPLGFLYISDADHHLIWRTPIRLI